MKVKSFGMITLMMLCGCLARSAPITGVTQTWTYDVETHKGTLHFENVSHRIIVAYTISVYVTYKDGHQFVLNESVYHREVFAPGQTRDEQITGPTSIADVDLTNPKNVRAEVDVVVYENDTAEVNNHQAFDQLMEIKQAEVEAAKTINEVVQGALDNTNVTDQHGSILAELKHRAMLAKSQQHFTLSSLLDVAADESGIPQSKADLQAFMKRNDQKIAELELHSNVQVTSGVQQ